MLGPQGGGEGVHGATTDGGLARLEHGVFSKN
jgi:hypothetical protein